MTTQSFTGLINTDGEFADLETLTGITFTASSKYSVQVQDAGDYAKNTVWKVANAEFTIPADVIWTYTSGADSPYIKTVNNPIKITILEGES